MTKREPPSHVQSQFSPDGSRWWNGSSWSPAQSTDGRWRWTGTSWIPANERVSSSAAMATRSAGIGCIAIGLVYLVVLFGILGLGDYPPIALEYVTFAVVAVLAAGILLGAGYLISIANRRWWLRASWVAAWPVWLTFFIGAGTWIASGSYRSTDLRGVLGDLLAALGLAALVIGCLVAGGLVARRWGRPAKPPHSANSGAAALPGKKRPYVSSTGQLKVELGYGESPVPGGSTASRQGARAEVVGPPAEVRPNWLGRSSARFTGVLVTGGIAVLIGLVIGPVLSNMPNAWIVDIPIVALVAIAAAGTLFYVLNERVGVLDGTLYRTTAFRRRRSWPISELREIVRVHIRVGGWTSEMWNVEEGVVDADLVVSKEGRAMASLTGWWEPEQLTALWAATGLRIHEPWRKSAITVQEVRARYPGAVPWLPLSVDSATHNRATYLPQLLVGAGGCVGAAILVVIVLAAMAMCH
jgi:hypothetical protein